MPRISISPGFVMTLALGIVIFPLRLVCAWLLAICVHEAGHYILLKMFNIPIYGVTFGALGLQMETDPMSGIKGLLCILGGPILGLLLVLLRKWMPILALFAFFQSVINLVPIYPMDGGRLLFCILERLPEKYNKLIVVIVDATVFIIALWIGFRFYFMNVFSLLPLSGLLFLLVKRKLSCKPKPQRVQ